MSFSDTVFLFFLALILFGPKKLPEMARQAGRLLAELRRASNEFKSQIETEIAHLEVEQHKNALPNPAPGIEASLSVNPAVGETIPHRAEPLATQAAPNVESPAELSSPAPEPNSTPQGSAESSVQASQESHV